MLVRQQSRAPATTKRRAGYGMAPWKTGANVNKSEPLTRDESEGDRWGGDTGDLQRMYASYGKMDAGRGRTSWCVRIPGHNNRLLPHSPKFKKKQKQNKKQLWQTPAGAAWGAQAIFFFCTLDPLVLGDMHFFLPSLSLF